ncbi:MAG: UbiA family prenyltransferase [Sphingomonadaceae bacterium]|uniref:4-hydroxybenzoate octaprenyltransferase n=1 Tax=Thermaurantiacus sp. TaxID=2820283 RepID=UPI00298EECE1|nr:4-hydroxybenzoate octaprenyltransferase [Thermaurantiacus sp.]MCS6986641.1 UbiA family prenyltransferase [Sphingomonadaceae bacterium]MDW8414097.1 4-hydroxybenzoate octaprenyltransferase [Thermaurantiacus sp.]
MTPDAVPGWVDRLPGRPRRWARLARFDRPAGIWLLFWPCAVGLFLSERPAALALLPWFFLGAVVMRAAGCIWNDLLDRDLDRKVARTAARPLASGEVRPAEAIALMAAFLGVGLWVLAQLPRPAQLAALLSLLPVAVYPLMKRITWWPQVWLGITFNWGVWVGWACGARPAEPVVAALAYLGLLLWTVGYDTIYATQDREDDALAGVRSAARRLGPHLKGGVMACYGAALLLLGAALYRHRPDVLAPLGLLPAAVALGWQAFTFRPDAPGNALARFRANVEAGGLIALAFAATFPWPGPWARG